LLDLSRELGIDQPVIGTFDGAFGAFDFAVGNDHLFA